MNTETAGQPQRAFYRAAVQLPAELAVEGVKHPIAVTTRNVGAGGAELETAFEQPLPARGSELILTLPTRLEALELPLVILHAEREQDDGGRPNQVLHVAFSSITSSQEDAIVAFINRLRMLEDQQLDVAAPVRVEVITGRRAYAVFTGHTSAIRPDYAWLHMQRFDHIEGADVAMRVFAPGERTWIEVDGTVTSVKVFEDHFDTEIEIAEFAAGSTHHEHAGDKLVAFLRQHYPEEPGTPRSGDQHSRLIPRPMRPQQPEHIEGPHSPRPRTGTCRERRLPAVRTCPSKDGFAKPSSTRSIQCCGRPARRHHSGRSEGLSGD